MTDRQTEGAREKKRERWRTEGDRGGTVDCTDWEKLNSQLFW